MTSQSLIFDTVAEHLRGAKMVCPLAPLLVCLSI
jgi:hypothetical protein